MTRLPYPRPNIVPKDDAWREVTLDHLGSNGHTTLWLDCAHCHHWVYEPLETFRARTGLAGDTPLLMISLALKCTRCGENWGRCKPKPYGIGDRT